MQGARSEAQRTNGNHRSGVFRCAAHTLQNLPNSLQVHDGAAWECTIDEDHRDGSIRVKGVKARHGATRACTGASSVL